MTRVTVFGPLGFIGKRLTQGISATPSFADICDRKRVIDEIRATGAEVVVNAAGRTGSPNVDWCEQHPDETIQSNVDGAVTLASACAELGVHLIHFGSGCIFYGRSSHPDGAWRENDLPNPIALYSKTKWSADQTLMHMPHVAILRLRMPVDGVPHPRNLITKLAGYRSVIDVVNSVTVVDDLIDVVRQVAERRLTGIFHATNPGAISHREVLALYRELVDPAHACEFIGEADLVTRGLATRARSNCVLASDRLEVAGIRMRPVGEAVRDALGKYA